MPTPSGNLSGLICAFSPAGEAFAIATEDGRVKTFDTGNGRLRVSLGDAPAPGGAADLNTCMAWVNSRKGKASKKAATSSALAVGTASGDVKLYDALMGELKWRTAGCIEGGVSAVAFSAADGGRILVTGASKQVCTLDLATGAVLATFKAGKQAVTCLALSADQQFVFGGGSSLALFSLADNERKAKFTGHPMPARAAAFAPDGQHAASAAAGESHVAVWATAPATQRPKKMHIAAASLALDEPAVALDIAHVADEAAAGGAAPADANGGASSSGRPFHVAALSEAGEAYVWLCSPAADSKGALEASLLARVRVGAAATAGALPGLEECVLAAKLQRGQNGPCLLVARGSSAGPAFQTVELPASAPAAGGAAPIVSLPSFAQGLLLGPDGTGGPTSAAGGLRGSEPDRPRLARGKGDVTALGAEGMAQPMAVRGMVAGADGVALVEPAAGGAAAGRKRQGAELFEEVGIPVAQEEEVMDIDEEDVTLEDRVAALEAAALGLRPPGDGSADGPPSTSGDDGPIKANSIYTLLTQALHSNDRRLLEQVLASTTNSGIQRNTVQKLQPADAVALLEAATARLLSRPSRAMQLIPWLNYVLLIHAGFLMSSQAATPALVSLFQAVEAHCASGEVVQRLLGRLDLVNFHLKSPKNRADAEDEVVAGPEVVFEDKGDDEEEDVDVVNDEDGDGDSGSGAWESDDPDAEGDTEEGDVGDAGGDSEEEDDDDDLEA